MTEHLLQFIWQFQYFNKGELSTSEGELLQIISPGLHNRNQGPDFANAKIKIGKTTWAGTVELHLRASDWKRHHHQSDKNYDNVILHVVWENDAKKNTIPVLELKNRIAKMLLHRYQKLMNSVAFIPCEKNIQQVNDITWQAWKDRLLAERLLRKAKIIENSLLQNSYHWEETFWWLLARNFGIKVNADAFEIVARSIPVNVLAKQRHQLHQLEALLLGQAGFLEEKFSDEYPALLQKEFQFQKSKHNLHAINVPFHFLRMRPGSFPTIRLAQLAMLAYQSNHLFSKIKETASVAEIKKWFDVTAGDYWHTHYRFDEISAFKKKKLGVEMINNIIINTIAPILFAYGNFHNEQKYKNKALQWLEEVNAEKNAITKKFMQLSLENKNAFDSQALIELKNEYCSKKRCLDCSIGNSLLKS